MDTFLVIYMGRENLMSGANTSCFAHALIALNVAALAYGCEHQPDQVGITQAEFADKLAKVKGILPDGRVCFFNEGEGQMTTATYNNVTGLEIVTPGKHSIMSTSLAYANKITNKYGGTRDACAGYNPLYPEVLTDQHGTREFPDQKACRDFVDYLQMVVDQCPAQLGNKVPAVVGSE